MESIATCVMTLVGVAVVVLQRIFVVCTHRRAGLGFACSHIFASSQAKDHILLFMVFISSFGDEVPL